MQKIKYSMCMIWTNMVQLIYIWI